jgi:hypothetical protein
MVNTRHS